MSEFIGIRGAKLGEAALKAICSRKIREIEIVIEKLNAGFKLNPVARLNEAVYYRNLMVALRDGSMKIDRIVAGIAALPVAIGPVAVLVSELGVHLGILKTHEAFEDTEGVISYEKLVKCRKSAADPWRDYFEVLEELEGEAPERAGYTVNYNGAAYASCPGYATLTEEGKVVDRHTCKTVFFTSEGWHAWRCPLCKTAFADLRGTSKSRGGVEKSVLSVVSRFKSGSIKRVVD